MGRIREAIEKLQSDARKETFGVAKAYDRSKCSVNFNDVAFCFQGFPEPTQFEELEIYYVFLMPKIATLYRHVDNAAKLKENTHWATVWRPSVNAEVIKDGDEHAVLINFGLLQVALSFDRMYHAHFASIMADKTAWDTVLRFANDNAQSNVPLIRCSDGICDEAGALIWFLLVREELKFPMLREIISRWPVGRVTVFADAIVAFYCAHEISHIARGHFDGNLFAEQAKTLNDFLGMRVFSRDFKADASRAHECDADISAASILFRSSMELGHNPVDSILGVSAWFVFLGLVERARMTIDGGEKGEQDYFERRKQQMTNRDHERYGISVDGGVWVFGEDSNSTASHPSECELAKYIANVVVVTGEPVQKLKANVLFRIHHVLVESVWNAVRGAFLHEHERIVRKRVRDLDIPSSGDVDRE